MELVTKTKKGNDNTTTPAANASSKDTAAAGETSGIATQTQEEGKAIQDLGEKIEEQTGKNKEQIKSETETLSEQAEKRKDILGQLGEAYTPNTLEVKDAFNTILDSFKGDNPIVNGLIDVAEKNLPKLLGLFQKTNKDINKDTQDATEQRNDSLEKGTQKTEGIIERNLENIQQHVTSVVEGINAIFTAINESLDNRVEEAEERYKALSEKYDEVTLKVEESNERMKTLHEEAKNAQGGRLAVIQDQLSREIEANKDLADEQKRLDDEKKKAEAEKEKLEKQQKKNELKMQIVQAIGNIALGITKALAMEPLVGPILATVVAAAGAIQIAQLNKQMAKLADGGLLRGKLHSQGGMRIEGTNIEVEGGEYVVNRQSTRQNLGLVRYINSQRRALTPSDIDSYFSNNANYGENPHFKSMFAEGGMLPSEDLFDNYDSDRMLRAIESINMQPIVSVVDIANAQKNLTTVTDWTNTSSF